MLTIKCSKCKKKLFKYLKIGKGEVLKCHKERIKKQYELIQDDLHYVCTCGNIIGKDEGCYIKMNQQAFMYTGTKE